MQTRCRVAARWRLARRLGLRDEAGEATRPLRELQVASPFDYPRQAALYIPRGLPEPASPLFVEQASEVLLQLAHVTGGRAFHRVPSSSVGC